MCSTSGLQMQLVFQLVCVATIVLAGQLHRIEKRSERCILPPYPKNGYYIVAGDPSAKPGDDPDFAFLNVTCDQGHRVMGNNVVTCKEGIWSTSMPRCDPICYLPKHPSVEYHCISSGSEGDRTCNLYEPPGTTVRPSCRENYYHTGTLPLMRCVEGYWDNVGLCARECGRIPEGGASLPWHVNIKKKDENNGNYKTICGGSIITNTIIVTAAHCFRPTSYSKVKPSQYIIVAGEANQSLDVSDIKIPPRFLGVITNFQSDIALVILKTSIEYSTHVQPVCVDFDTGFESRQLQQGNLGKVSVISDPVDNRSSFEVLDIPYISIEQCITNAPPHFREYITPDKICAGRANGTLICTGSSGAGLTFSEEHRGITRYYLRGVVSTSPSQGEICAPSDIIAFTQFNKHEYFLREHLV